MPVLIPTALQAESSNQIISPAPTIGLAGQVLPPPAPPHPPPTDAARVAVPAAADALSWAARAALSPPHLGPLFLADWIDVVMVHFALPRRWLQPCVPLPLDCIAGDAFVSLVAFRQRNLRPAWPELARESSPLLPVQPAAPPPARGGWRQTAMRLGRAVMRPLAAHDFLNLRTYVQHRGEAGIYFMAEVLSSRLAVYLGPLLYGLPYSFGRVQYLHDFARGEFTGAVRQAATGREVRYHASLPHGLSPAEVAALPPAPPGSIDAFLLERYVAFTQRGGVQRRFRIWHEPWRQCRAAVTVARQELIAGDGPHAQLIGANVSPGVKNVWIGPPGV